MKYLKVFTDFAEDIKELNDTEVGRLFRAMLSYAETGTAPDLRGNERYLWGTAKKNIDAQKKSYESKVEGAEKARNKKTLIPLDIKSNQEQSSRFSLISSQEQEQEQEQEQDKEQKKKEKTKKKEKRFAPPTRDEVHDYCRQRNSPVDPDQFYDFFDAGNWIDSNGKPVIAWKQKLITWEKFNHGKGNYAGKTVHQPGADRAAAQYAGYEFDIQYDN